MAGIQSRSRGRQMEKKCPSCENPIDSGMNVCPKCGSDLHGKGNSRFKKFMVVIVAIMFITTSIFIYFITQKVEDVYRPKGIEIDGNFEDWTEIAFVPDDVEHHTFNQNIDIYEYRIDGKLGELSFNLKVLGNVLEGEPGGEQHVDTFYFFIDADQDPSTGFLIRGIGSDFMIEIFGFNSEVVDAGLYSYSSSEHDWDLWEYKGSAEVEAEGVEMEVQVKYKTLNLGANDNVDAIICARSWDGFEDFTDLVVSNEVGILEVTQWGNGPSVISDESDHLMELKLRAWNTNISIEKIRIKRMGTGSDSDLSKITLEDENRTIVGIGTLSNGYATFHLDTTIEPGTSMTYYCFVELASIAIAENTIGFRIEQNHDISIDRGTVSLRRARAYGIYSYEFRNNDFSYMISRPDNVTADGAFSDWRWPYTISDDRMRDVSESKLDIIRYGISNSEEELSFYLKVYGFILNGEEIPHRNEITETSVNRDDFSPKTGEDVIHIFINTINSSGYNLDLPFQTDYMIEIKGYYNQISTALLYQWVGTNPSDWSWKELGSVRYGMDNYRIEVTIGWDDIGIDPKNDYFEVMFKTSDYRDEIMDLSNEVIVGPGR
jgi:hypothetical protein